MELKVWVEGIQRIVCGVTEKTTCQDVVYALAHATGKTGRFTLIERWRNNERLLAPQEHPLKVLAKWGEYSNDVQFILQRSPLDSKSGRAGSEGAVRARPSPAPAPGPVPAPPAIWKSPPGAGRGRAEMARLSPDSGRGSDPTGSDTSNFSEGEKLAGRGVGGARATSLPGYTAPPPAYRPPPPPHRGPGPVADPPPYREPPPPAPRPHYSPPPQPRDPRHGHRGPSPARPGPAGTRGPGPAGSPARGQSWQPRPPPPMQQAGLPRPSDYSDLVTLVSAQQTRLQSQHAEIKHCENELRYWDGRGGSTGPAEPPLEAVMAEVARLEAAASQNEAELSGMEGGAGAGIRGELDQLKHRLEMTDIELQKTNTTLRRLGEEMRSYSLEKTREREVELRQEVERIQGEIRLLQRNSEDSATISDKLSREVQEVEAAIQARKSEVEKLIADMKSANLESLTISPPEENKVFLDDGAGPVGKAGSARKMLGSPRQLENAVPTSKNPHGVWV